MGIGNLVYISSMLYLCFLVNRSSAVDVENLKIGCFKESPSNRHFRITPGDYKTWSLTPYVCVKLCGGLSYDFAALQNGNLCFCADSFNVSQEASVDCTANCTGDKTYSCGGTWANLVYNSTSYGKKFVINQFGPLRVFEWVNMSAVFVNDSSTGLRVSFNIGDENGDSPGESTMFKFKASFWGRITVKVRALNIGAELGYSHRELYIHADPGRAEINCPSVVRTGHTLRCIAKIYEGTNLHATWMFKNGDIKRILLPDPLYVRAGPAVPQWSLSGLTSPYSTGVFLLPYSQFTSEARVLALEIYGHTAGEVKVFIMRPVCTSPTHYFCPSNMSCFQQLCPTHPSYYCLSPSIFCASKSCCNQPPSENCSQANSPTNLSAGTLHIVADIGVLAIKTGYNLHVLPKDHNVNVLPGDMIAWGQTANGKIAQNAGRGTVYHFSGLNAQTLQSGTNVSISQSQLISDLNYMVKIIGSQAAMFEFSHQFNSSGMYWAQVKFNDTHGNALAPIVKPFLVQSFLTEVRVVYPPGFSFFGAKINEEIELIVNTTTEENITVSWTLVNSSTLIRRESLQNKESSFVVDRLNQTFPSLGTYLLLVEAANNVSVVNTTVLIHVQNALSDLFAFVISDKVYLSALTELNVSISGSNAKFKWDFGDGSRTSYISNTTVLHRFSKMGPLNVSIIATNLAFTKKTWLAVDVLHPLSIFVPSRGEVGVFVNVSCSLNGAFASDQYYYWDYGDGSTEEGLNKAHVTHNYANGGTYTVSVKLRSEVIVNASSKILVLEPVSGLKLDNITGIELFDKKTFTAHTKTGNNLTYEWYLYGNDSITIMICTNNSIELSFNSTGMFTVSVNVSNSVSFEFASVTFSVQQRILGVSITAFPNPAPSNSTITFNITKGTGSDVKYRLDFGDGFVSRDFPEHYLFNRTFISGRWQIILTAENAVNQVIVFYNLTIQDPIENMTIGFVGESEFHGRKLVAVGTKTSFYSKVSAGTDVFFRWNFGDRSTIRTFKGSKMLTGDTNHSVGHSFANTGQFNVTVDAFNVISQLKAWILVYAQERIEGFKWEVTDYASPGNSITFQFSQTKGSNVSYIINFGDGEPSQTITSKSLVKTYNSVGVFNVTVKAANQLSSQNITKTITVQDQIQGLAFVHPIAAAEKGSPSVISWRITRGSDVKFVINYGDGSAPYALDAIDAGRNITVRHNYTSWGAYTVQIIAYNLVGPNRTITGKAMVDEAIEGLLAYAKQSTIQMYQSVVIVASILKGSRVTYEFQFADGSNAVQTLNNTFGHRYTKHGQFNVTVTARNSITAPKKTQLNETITVEKPNTPMEIRGLSISCQATTPGNASKILITFDHGFLFQCQVDFGDGRKRTFTDENLTNPLLHTYREVGRFNVTAHCENQLGSRAVNTLAWVDEYITGLRFKTGNGVINTKFALHVDIEWIWETGTNVNLSVALSGHGSVSSQQTGKTGSVKLSQSLCPNPGKYVFSIELSNSVTSPQRLQATVTFLEEISDLTIRYNPVARTGSGVLIYVSVKSGLDVRVRWKYGDGNFTDRQTKGFGKQQFVDSHVYATQGKYQLEVEASNENSSYKTKGNITVISAVEGFSFHQKNKAVWPSRNITFHFNRESSLPALLNSTYCIYFGNGEKSTDEVVGPAQTQFSYNYTYYAPGCYSARLIIWNFVSRVELSAPVEIIQPITNAKLKALNSEYSAHPGTSGGGSTLNTFPFEYPVSFEISQDTGSCLRYDWTYGDFHELQNVTTAVTTHAYPLPGSYNVTAKVYNSLGEKILKVNITLQHTVRGLYLAASASVRPEEIVTFVVFCLSLGTDSQFVFNPGEGNNVTLKRKNFKNTTRLKAENNLSPNINLPFDPSDYYAQVYSHNYTSKGLFEAQVWAWNEASQQLARTLVAVRDEPVPVPQVRVRGGQKSLTNITPLVFGTRFSLCSSVEISSNKSYKANFKWAVFKADSYNSPVMSPHVQLPPESGREVSLPSDVITDQSSITIPALRMDPGDYIFKLTVSISDVGVSNADYTYVKIADSDIEARIAGGDFKSHDWDQWLLLNATGSIDPLLPGDKLSHAWFCSITKNDYGIVTSSSNCFGNGENQVEFKGKVFKIAPRSLIEATTYAFTVNVSSLNTSRWSTATQTVKVLAGDPPDIGIRCESNCEIYLNPSSRLVLTTTCLNCEGIDQISYNWSAEDANTSASFPIWPNRARTPRDSHNAVILGNTFHSGSSYKIRINASRPNSEVQGFAEFNIKTNNPPKGGSCNVTPTTGEELKTKFKFLCSGWQDEHEPLTYEMFYSYPRDSKDPGSSQNGVLFFLGPSVEFAEFLFPAGKEEDGHFIDVVVKIKDAYGESVKDNLTVQVKPRNVTLSELTSETNQIKKALDLGADIVAVQLSNVISNILNDKKDTSNVSLEENKLIRLNIIKYLANFRPQNLGDLLIGSQALQAATGVVKETTVEAQVLTTKQYANMANILIRRAQKREDGGIIEEISNEMLKGLSNVLLASSVSYSDSSKETADKEIAKGVLSDVLNLVENVSDAILHTMIPGQSPLVLNESEGVAIGLSKKNPDKVTGLSVDVGGEEKFVLSHDESLFYGIKNSSHVTTTVTKLSTNPFHESDNSSRVKTSPFSLVLKGADGNAIVVKGLKSPINVFLPVKEPIQITLNISQTPSASGSMSLHKVTVPNSDSALKAEILPSDESSELTVYFRFSEPPSLIEYDVKTTLPHQDHAVGNYTLFVSLDQMQGTGDYYIGILPTAHNNEPTETAVNYTLDVISSACYFWDESSKEWNSEGCKVHNQTTRRLTRCQCSHLTWFGADLFIPPNKLDIKASIRKLAQLHKHPALLATFCTITGLYILGMVWARRKDRRDITKVGLVPVLDNDPSDRYCYEVTVHTARGKNTGTTANVSILIAGEEGQSAVHMLKSTSRTCLQQGSVDSFLITTSDCLGSLTYIRMWHNNSGKSPSWFVSRVVIRDIETDEKFFFLCNSWLACEEGDGQVDRLFPVAGKDELSDFVHLFKTKTTRDFSDGHLWFSIAFRPVRSRFTCMQRVSCCLSLLMCSMLANVLWYRTPVQDQNSVLIDLGFFEFTWHEVLVGVQSSLIVFPINLLIVQLFRNRGVSPKVKQKYAERTTVRGDSDIKTKVQSIARQQTTVSLSDITPTASRTEMCSLKQKHATLKNLTRERAPVTARKDSWDENFFCTLIENKIDAPSEDTEHKTKKQKSLDNVDPLEMPDFLSSDIYYYLYQDESYDREKVCPEPTYSRDSVGSTSPLVPPEKPKKTKTRKKMNCIFPWWFVYFGWFLCVSTAAAAGFFTLLYGLQFENKQQEEWLVSMFVSMFQDILISQPLKVIIVAIFFALLFKKPQDEEDDVINAELARDEEWLEKNLSRARKEDGKIAATQSLRPPDKTLLQATRVRLFKERKMHSVIREIVFYLMFVWIVLLAAYGHRDPYAHFMMQNIENTFVGHQESPGTQEDDKHETTKQKPVGDDTVKFSDVPSVKVFWEWMNQTLVPGIYSGAWYNGKRGQPGFLDDKMSYVVGVARMRQLRVKSGTCKVDQVFDSHVGVCDEPYSWDAEDQTPYYEPGWRLANQNTSYYQECSAWHYKTTAEIKTRPFLGHLALYRGGGYKVDFSSTIESASSMLEDLKMNNWVDKYTRAVFIEFTVYNGYSNLYCVANLLVEFTAAGGAVPFIQLLSTRIDRYVGHFLIFVLVCEVSFVLFILFFTYREFKRFLKTELKDYMTEFWTWIELTLLGLSWAAIVLYVVRFGLDQHTKKTFRKNPQEFVDFQYLALVDQLFGYVYAFVVFMTSVKFLRLFRFNRRMSLLGCTIKTAGRELAHFGIIFGLVFVGFSHLCYLVFSHELYKFHTFVTTVETLVSVMLGKFSYVSLERTNRVLGPLMFFFYSIGVVFILVNMFLSIIIENFNKVKQSNDLQSNEHEIIDFITEQFMSWMGFRSRSIFRNRVHVEELPRPKYKKHKRKNEAQQLKERIDRLVTLIKKVHFDVGEDNDFLRNDGEVTYLIPNIKIESYS